MSRILTRLLPLSALALVADWLTKGWAERALELHQPVPIVGQFFRLTLNYNTGVAFSMFVGGGRWLAAASGIIIVGLLVWSIRALRSGTLPPAASWPIGLILGGAMANFVDRLPDGRVTDFLDVGLAAARWPTFNLADTWIVLGIALLFLMAGFEQRSASIEALS